MIILSKSLPLVATVLALCVVILGAYTRLKDAGLGCPDWPGCYGQWQVPQTTSALQRAKALYPQYPVETAKAWPEMVHRYVAGSLVVLILTLAGMAVIQKQARILSFSLVALVAFQAMLGMWTVTWRLFPAVVMAHLLCGLLTLALLARLSLTLNRVSTVKGTRQLRVWAMLGLVMVIIQIALGGWTSANHAALACPDFPYCFGQWIPALDWSHAFNIFAAENPARVTIQFMHRLGFFITVIVVGGLGFHLMFWQSALRLRRIGGIMIGLLGLQMVLGIVNVVALLPLGTALAHHAVAAVLLLTMVTLQYSLRGHTT